MTLTDRLFSVTYRFTVVALVLNGLVHTLLFWINILSRTNP